MKGLFGGITGLIRLIGNIINTTFIYIFVGRSYSEPSNTVDAFVGGVIVIVIIHTILDAYDLNGLEYMFPIVFFILFIFGIELIIDLNDRENKKK